MTLSQIHDRLLEIQAGIRQSHLGICSQIMYSRSCILVEALAMSWPTRNPETYYPVDGADEFYRTDNMWQNPRRLALLQHCIDRTKSVDVFPVEDFRRCLTDEYSGYEERNEQEIQELLS